MKRQTYTPEIKERAVRMLIEASGDYPSTWSVIQAWTGSIKPDCTVRLVMCHPLSLKSGIMIV